MSTIVEHYGTPVPPLLLLDILSSHPLAGMRNLAWRVVCLWLGWDGPKKEELRLKYVYNPGNDPENGKNGAPIQDVPIPDLSLPENDGEEWLQYWPRTAGRARWEPSENRLHVLLEQPCLDAWVYSEEIIRLTEEAQLTNCKATNDQISSLEDSPVNLKYDSQDLNALSTDIHGIYMLRESCLPNSSKPKLDSAEATLYPLMDKIEITSRSVNTFVATAPAVLALRQLAVCVAARAPVLLSSPSSAGKSATLYELHRCLHASPKQGDCSSAQIVHINLADRSLDAKTLLGSLSSSPTDPGTFVFVEGSLTRAIRTGRWLLLEDIDKAAEDVLATVSELVERIRNRVQTFVGGGWGGAGKDAVGVTADGKWVEAAEGFMLFATRSVLPSSTDESALRQQPAFLGCQYWTDIWMDLPTLDETRQIVSGTFPKLHEAMVAKLVDMWHNVKLNANSPTGSSGSGMSRNIGLRDLMRWCNRVNLRLPADIEVTSSLRNPVFQEELFLEARDIFLGSYVYSSSHSAPAPSSFSAIIEILQDGLSLNRERIDWLLAGRTPELTEFGTVDSEEAFLQIGRARLRRQLQKRPPRGHKHPYALTKPFLDLLERLAVSAELAEPILLVGETGTGKTAAIGHLADRLGTKLVVANLSNQTEASDLLGGFKPVDEADQLNRVAHHS